jgi:hypothetical protein
MKNTLLLLLCALPLLAFAQPANDNCANATLLYPASTYSCTSGTSGTLQNATASAPVTTCTGTADDDVWYRFTATSTRHLLTVSNVTGTTSAIMKQVFTGGCAGTSFYCSSTESNMLNDLTIGTVYHIRLYTYVATPNLDVDFSICVSTPNPAITTTVSEYTHEELVNDILFNGTGIQATNVTSSTGTNFGSVNGIGYFTDGGTDFPFENGVILSTGSAEQAPGPNTNTQNGGSNGWQGDPDVLTAIQQISTGTISCHNASKLELDFTAVSDSFSLSYIYASEEYGDFQCMFSDTFVILLTDLSTQIMQNIGVIPGTTTPVSVVTVRNNQYNTACSSLNQQFFGAFYPHGSSTAPINFNGRTVPMVAEATLVPGHTYHLKIAIADRNDNQYDSALFIEGISSGLPETVNIGTPNDLHVCDPNLDGVATFDLTVNDIAVLNGQDPDDFTIAYFETLQDAEANAVSNAIQTPESYTNIFGMSTQTIYVRLSSALTDDYAVASFEIAAVPVPVAENPAPVYIIGGMDGQATLDLTAISGQIMGSLNPSSFNITFHATQQDANSGENDIFQPQSYVTGSGTVYFRLENMDTSCYDIGPIVITVLPYDYETPPPSGDSTQSFEDGDTLADLEAEGDNIQWYATPGETTGPPSATDTDTPLALTTLLTDGTTYYASQTVYGIESRERLPVQVMSSMGTHPTAFSGFAAFPNPAKDVLNISNNNTFESITLYDLTGKVVLHKAVQTTQETLPISRLSSGLYLLKIVSGGRTKVVKLAKE